MPRLPCFITVSLVLVEVVVVNVSALASLIPKSSSRFTFRLILDRDWELFLIFLHMSIICIKLFYSCSSTVEGNNEVILVWALIT